MNRQDLSFVISQRPPTFSWEEELKGPSVTGFTPLDSSFDRFLYACVLERNEAPVSVLSALARQGLDPWQEAIRLAGLPRRQAANSLAETISQCGGATSPNAASEAAWRLVELLPMERTDSIPHAGEESISWWLVFGIFLFMMAISTNTNPPSLKNSVRPQIVTIEQTARTASDTPLSGSSSERGQLARNGLSK